MGNCMTTPQVVDGPGSGTDVAHSVGGSARGKSIAKGATAAAAQTPPATPPAGPPKPDALKLHQMKKRIAVAAEAISNAADIEVPVVPKTEIAEKLIGGWGVGAGCGW
jgi:hypothetical protein